ncbi:MAG: DMT family transporter [Pseudomonadota bacterium]
MGRWRQIRPELRGILLVVGGMFVLAIMDAFNKSLAVSYPPAQIIWLRFVFSIPVVAVFILPRYGWRILKTRRPGLQLLRSVMFAVQMTIAISVFAVMPLADVHALLATTPLFVTALSFPILGERVGRMRWIAVAIGFFGMLVIVRPGFVDPEPATFLALVAAFMFAIIQFITRVAARADGAITTLALQILGVSLVLTLAAPFIAVPIALADIPAFIAIALLGALGHFCLIAALSLAPAVVIQPFTYSILIYATIIGYLVFGDLPGPMTVIGGLIIASAGIFALRHEQRQSRLARANPT